MHSCSFVEASLNNLGEKLKCIFWKISTSLNFSCGLHIRQDFMYTQIVKILIPFLKGDKDVEKFSTLLPDREKELQRKR